MVSKLTNLDGKPNAMMKKIVFTCAAFIFLQITCLAQVSEVKRSSDITVVPPSIKYPGKAKDILRWSDSQGSHLVILSELISASKNDLLGRDAEIFAGHYLEVDGQWVQQWKVTDFERNCPVDVGASYIPQSIMLTDLNKNRIAEVSFMYRTYCTGGVDPHSLKFIMYEGKKKYAIRGETLVKLPEQPVYGGAMTIDSSFKYAPKEFQQFAATQWEKFRLHPLK